MRFSFVLGEEELTTGKLLSVPWKKFLKKVLEPTVVLTFSADRIVSERNVTQ